MNPRAIFESPSYRRMLAVAAVASLAIGMFFIGNAIGFHRASFALQWGQQYGKNFGDPALRGIGGHDAPSAHGATGRIEIISLPKVIIAGPDGWEKTVLINEKTAIRRLRKTVLPAQLETGEYAVVIGRPTADGQVEASFIRLMPLPAGAVYQQ